MTLQQRLDEFALAFGVRGSVGVQQRGEPHLQLGIFLSRVCIAAKDVAELGLQPMLLITSNNQVQMVIREIGPNREALPASQPAVAFMLPTVLSERSNGSWHIAVGCDNGKQIDDGFRHKSGDRCRADVLYLQRGIA